MDETIPTNLDQERSPALRNEELAAGLIGFGLLLFLVMGLSVCTRSLFYVWDQPINAYFARLYQNSPEWIRSIARYLNIAGSEGITVATVILLVVWAISGQSRYFWLLLVTVFGARIVWLVTLFAIGRARPTEVRALFDVILPGFPSGSLGMTVAISQ